MKEKVGVSELEKKYLVPADLKKSCFWELAEAWPSPYVAREKIGEFSGYILNPRTMANADSLHLGPKGKIRFGRKVAYHVKSLIEWMNDRIESEQEGQE